MRKGLVSGGSGESIAEWGGVGHCGSGLIVNRELRC